MDTFKIGFIGQGYVGKNYADDFENRGYEVIRYAKEDSYIENKALIKSADVVFIAVPTPTVGGVCDSSVVESVLSLVGNGKIAVIKSTILPGTTDRLQEMFPDIHILFSPEFLLEQTAAHDASNPIMNIVGFSHLTESGRVCSKMVMDTLPESTHKQICTAREAELIKYIHNVHAVFRILFANIFFDLANVHTADWEELKKAMGADPYLSEYAHYYDNPIHKGGRGAGGGCFPKDLAALQHHYAEVVGDSDGARILEALATKNKALLCTTGKSLEQLKGIYGEGVCNGN